MSRIIRLAGVFSLVITMLIGVSGCAEKPEDYKKDIHNYLEAKYDEEFVVESMSKEIGLGTNDLIRAKCHSKQFPENTFILQYQLDFRDIHNEEETADLLKQSDSFSNEHLKEWEDEVEPYFEDDYANILYQSKFNKMVEGKIDLKNDHLIQTRFETLNYFTSLSESQVELENYLETENYDLYAYHFLFIKDEGESLNTQLDMIRQVSSEIANSRITEQYILVYFLSEFSKYDIQKHYYEHYEFPDDYFADLDICTSSADVTLVNGVINESNEVILKMLGE